MNEVILIISIIITDPAAHSLVIPFKTLEKCLTTMQSIASGHTLDQTDRNGKLWGKLSKTADGRSIYISYGVKNISLTCAYQ